MWRKQIFNFSKFYSTALFLIFDIIAISITLYLAVLIRLDDYEGIRYDLYVADYTGATFFTYFCYLFSFYLFNLYRTEKTYIVKERIGFIIVSVIFGAFLIMISSFIFQNWKHFRWIIFLQMAFLAFWMIFLGSPFRNFVKKANLTVRKKVLIVGTGKSGQAMAELLSRNFSSDFQVVGFLGEKIKESLLPILGDLEDIRKVAKQGNIDLVVSCLTYAQTSKLLKDLFQVRIQGCDVIDMPVLYSKLTGKIPVQYVGDECFVYGPYFTGNNNALFLNLTRFFDIFLAFLSLVLALPLMLICAVMIKMTMPGPILYFQTRLGLNRNPYRIIKFRSMRVGAEKGTGPTWAKGKKDGRATLFGKFMRRTRLDELPQLVNVLKGDMSFLGPRPERPYFVNKLLKKIPYYGLRFSVKPGLTGWAQVNLLYEEDWEKNSLEKLQYDLYYIQESSVFLNIVILFKTLQTVISKPGS